MRPSAARTSSSSPNIVPLLTDDDSDDENKRLDRELHKDLVNSLRDTVSAFGGISIVLYSDVMSILVALKRFAFLCLLRFLSRADSKLTDDVFLYRYVLGSVRLCERVRHLAPVLLSQQQQQRRRKRTRRSGCIVTFERDGGRRQSEQPSASISQTWW